MQNIQLRRKRRKCTHPLVALAANGLHSRWNGARIGLPLLLSCVCSQLPATDCNENGREDALDLARSIFAFRDPVQAIPAQFPPGAFATADLDADGDLDVIASFRLVPPESWILWNGGDGRFAARTTIPLGIVNDPREILAADLTGDGRLDIARVDPVASQLELFRGAGERRFEPSSPIALGARPVGVVLADVDGDLDTDLISLGLVPIGGIESQLDVQLQDAAHAFHTKQTVLVKASETLDMAVLDMNADSRPDLVLSIQKGGFAGGQLVTLLNRADGTGAFNDARYADSPAVATRFASLDLDGDSTLDLSAVAKNPPSLLLLTGRSDGGFAAIASVPFDTPSTFERAMPGDIDGDADTDLLLVHSAGLRLVVNDGGGFHESELIHPHASLYGVQLADLGGNGKPELVTYREYPSAILLSRGHFIPLEQDCDRNGVPDTCDLALSDCNSDQIPDACELGPVEAAFAVQQELVLPASPSRVSLADLDGDRDLDFLGTAPNTAHLLESLNDGSGRFAPPIRILVPIGVSDHVALDLSGDGRPDVVVVHPQGMAVYFNSGRGAMELTQSVALKSYPTAEIAAGDIDGDGDLDVCALHRGDDLALRIQAYANDGRGSLAAAGPPLVVEPVSSYSDRRIALVDLDGDDDLDLARTDSGAPSAFWHAALGDGRFEAGRELPVRYTSGSFLLAGDLNSDGMADLVFSRSSAISILENVDRGQLFESRELESGWGRLTTVMATGDFDGDGRVDLAVSLPEEVRCERANRLLPAIGAWKQDASGNWIGPGLGVDLPDASWTKALASGDLNGDGRDDLVALEEPIECAHIPNEPCPGKLVVLRGEPHSVERDCNRNGRLDDCEPDCDGNLVPDDCDLAGGIAIDCNRNGLLDSCEASCNADGVPDDCEISSGRSLDCNQNGVPDECDARARDANHDGVPDECDIADGTAVDCNRNGIFDEIELAPELLFGVPRTEPSLKIQSIRFLRDVDGDTDLDQIVIESSVKAWDDNDDLGMRGCASRLARVRTEWNEGGRFVSGPEVLLGYREIHSAELADLDGDGLPELLVTETVLGAPAASFQSSTHGLIVMRIVASGYPEEIDRVALSDVGSTVASGDFDGDAALDLAVGSLDPGRNSTLTVLRNDGRGRLSPGPVVTPGGDWNVLVAADLDGDRRTDLALGTLFVGGPLQALYADAQGSFPSQVELGEERQLVSLQAGDLNHDGQADLIAGFSDGVKFFGFDVALEVIESRGRGRFVRKGSVDFGLASVRGSPLIADIDEDGDLDFTAFGYLDEAGSHAGVAIVRNDGSGAIGATEIHPTVDLEKVVAFGNFAGSAEPDLLFDSAIAVGLGRGRFEWPAYLTTQRLAGGAEPRDLEGTDLNGDGRSDFATATSAGVSLLLSRLQGPPASELLPNGSRPKLLFASDVDRDGDIDLLTINERLNEFPSTLSVYANEGGGRFSGHQNLTIGSTVTAATLLDADGDGDQDLAVSEWEPGSIALLENVGGGAFAPRRIIGSTASDLATALAAADVDGDLDLDLIAGLTGGYSLDDLPYYCQSSNGQHRLVSMENQGQGRFLEHDLIDWRPGRLDSLAAADLDGSGALQMLVGLRECHQAPSEDEYELIPRGGVYRLGGAGQWDFTRLEFAPRWLPADLDGDGDIDLPYHRGVLLQVSGGRFEPIELNGWRTENAATALGDADGDQDLDLVAAQADEIRVIENRSRARGQDRDRDGIPDDCPPATVVRFIRGDANADSRTDIADAIAIVRALFTGETQPTCLDAADTNDDGAFNVTDAITLLARLFLGASPLAEPRACGGDRTPDGLNCAAFAPCAGGA